jgi:cytochrome b561
MHAPDHFSRTQVILHWVIAALILFQFVFSDGMSIAWRAFERGAYVATDFSTGALMHIVVGVAILFLAIWRVVLRLRNGGPAPDPVEPKALQLLAKIVHVVLYATLFLMPISGMMAWGGGVLGAGEAHQAIKMVLIVAVVLHIAGALVHQFVWKTDVLKRMLGMA